ncbi:MAG: hypothetical protein HOD60_00910 [Candidatus Nitrosopelagicus sp.]|jgi:hypothetical protein|nr:hypothetical protein [Candidatus Nitrosopelagicus sp.]
MRKFASIKPFYFDDSILFSITKNWINQFNSMPEFDVFIDSKNKMHLISKQKVTKSGGGL